MQWPTLDLWIHRASADLALDEVETLTAEGRACTRPPLQALADGQSITEHWS
jgi:hypothetical protein